MMGLLSAVRALPRWAWWVAAVLAVALAFAGWLRSHDKAVIAADRAPAALASAQADAIANTNDTARAIDQARALDANERAIADAQASHPAEVRVPAGRSVNAIADELRARQAKAGAAAGQ